MIRAITTRATGMGKIEGIENGLLESRWVEQQLGHPVIKVFNNIYAEHLAKRGKPPGTPDASPCLFQVTTLKPKK